MYGVPGGLVQMFRGSTTMFDRAFGDFYDSMADLKGPRVSMGMFRGPGIKGGTQRIQGEL